MIYRFYKGLSSGSPEMDFPFESATVPTVPPQWDGVWDNAQLAAYQASITPEILPATFAEYTNIEMFVRAVQGNLVKYTNFLEFRTALKSFVLALGNGNEDAGFEAISPGVNDSPEKAFVSAYNIGSGAQRLLAIPSDEQRDLACYNYIKISEGVNNASKAIAAVWLKAIAFSRADHIAIAGTTIPSWIFAKLVITSQSPYEISGNLWDMYYSNGIEGFALDNPPLGIVDYIMETGTAQGLTFDTRYAPANGGGLRTNATLVAAVAADPYGISGFASLGGFANFMYSIMLNGKPSY